MCNVELTPVHWPGGQAGGLALSIEEGIIANTSESDRIGSGCAQPAF